MNVSDGSILEEGLTHEYFWLYQNRRKRTIRRTAAYVLGEIERTSGPGPLLEIGVGMGLCLRHLAEGLPSGTPVVGIDNDPTMIAYAARAIGGLEAVRLELMDAREGLPFPDGSFSVVYAEHCFHHMDHTRNALHEIARVMSDDGVFIFIDLAPERFLSRLFMLLYPFFKRLRIKWKIGEGAYRSLKKSTSFVELNRLFQKANLEVASLTHKRFNQRITLRKGRPNRL